MVQNEPMARRAIPQAQRRTDLARKSVTMPAITFRPRLVDRSQRLVPAPDDGDDFVGICDPLEWLGLGVVFFEEAIDRGLEVDEGSEDAALQTALRQSRP